MLWLQVAAIESVYGNRTTVARAAALLLLLLLSLLQSTATTNTNMIGFQLAVMVSSSSIE